MTGNPGEHVIKEFHTGAIRWLILPDTVIQREIRIILQLLRNDFTRIRVLLFLPEQTLILIKLRRQVVRMQGIMGKFLDLVVECLDLQALFLDLHLDVLGVDEHDLVEDAY